MIDSRKEKLSAVGPWLRREASETSSLYDGEQFGLYDRRFEHDACGVGFVCDIKGRKSHDIIQKGIEVLRRLSHRGAVGADPKTGDGAGILIQIPDEFLRKECAKLKISLPEFGNYGVGLVFLPQDDKERKFCLDAFEKIIKQEKEKLLGFREIEVDSSIIGKTAQNTQPKISQIFIEKSENVKKGLDFERKLYLIRKQVENIICASTIRQKDFFYITNISSQTLIYKGLLMPDQVDGFFPELKDESLTSSLCLVHSRYSTNTFPTWDLAQPFRYLAHNGEINTLRGNINWMQAREGLLKSIFFNKDIEKLKPVIVPGGSDSAVIDNVFELLFLSGRSLSHVMSMLIPSAWEQNKELNSELKNFYKYHVCFMEPWDGPAAIAFTDGTNIGAVLDRNGLRPCRYIVTKDDFVVMASEVGVLDIEPKNIKLSGRLNPGKMFYIDTKKGRIIGDDEIKKELSAKKPYGKWLKENLVSLDDVKGVKIKEKQLKDTLTLLKAFGYSKEDLKMIISPMVQNSQEPIGSMGNDTPLAVLSKNPQLLYSYFKQLFAQVTNPAIDPIREEIVMTLESFVGSQKNILEETDKHCHKLYVKNPILENRELEKIKKIKQKGFKAKVISILFKVDDKKDFRRRLDEICKEAELAIKDGYSFIILSDKGVASEMAALPALLAAGTIHQYLVKKALRTQIGIILETAEPREVHHFALLFGYGVDCINPYLSYDAIEYLISTQGGSAFGGKEKELDLDYKTAIKNYRKALSKGILKILSKMGISTLHSYRGAQVFEAIGIANEVIEKSFSGTPSRIGGVGFVEIEKETLLRHSEAFPKNKNLETPYLAIGGLYQWKKGGEFHLWNPETIASLQDAVRKNNYSKFKEFSNLINDQSNNPTTLRSLLKFSAKGETSPQSGGKKIIPIPLDQVEPKESIFKRFATGAMSFGSISKGAHETLALAMNKIGAKSNTGEGGEDPARFIQLPNGDSLRSAIKQVASGRFGVTTNYLVNADELQIKIAQGAKPGEGGQLPGHKVSEIIARTRYTTPGVTLISPPPHHDIYSIEDLAQLIFDLKNVNPKARISVKLVSEIGVGTVAAGVAKGHADMILISGGDGGTGASPLSSIKHAGLPWELGISETHQTLVLNDLRSRVRLQTDGQMRTGRDVAIAAILGAEEYGFCTAALIIMGCVMLRHCHLNNCSVGVATQDEILQKRFLGRPDYVINYFNFVVQELREIMASLGVRNINEMIGNTELLEVNKQIIPWKAKNIDYSRILYKPEVDKAVGKYCMISQDHAIDNVLDKKLIEFSKDALESAVTVNAEFKINNTNRTTGAMLSGEVCKRFGEDALPEGTINFKFKGVAGQSFGAFLAKGINFELEGQANDYVGKGISGGKIIIYPDKKTDYDSSNNVIIGNTCFYGAIKGEAYIKGVAGERFCIRNSGLLTVVEGVGDHGCEYMTGGRVIILGETGRNFGAGMSGGIAYIYDEDKNFASRCNLEMVELDKPNELDRDTLHNLIFNHYKYTKSTKAKFILDNFKQELKKFIKVMPLEYKRILEAREQEEKLGLGEPSDG
ncbi:MAG: glutamate synthase large subunit [Candidatus Omnitrophota bacterium]